MTDRNRARDRAIRKRMAETGECYTVAARNNDAEQQRKRGEETAELYCVDSGRPVKVEGDRCIRHGDRSVMCTTAVRPAQCTHPRLSPNHPYPHCSECGRDVPEGEAP